VLVCTPAKNGCEGFPKIEVFAGFGKREVYYDVG